MLGSPEWFWDALQKPRDKHMWKTKQLPGWRIWSPCAFMLGSRALKSPSMGGASLSSSWATALHQWLKKIKLVFSDSIGTGAWTCQDVPCPSMASLKIRLQVGCQGQTPPVPPLFCLKLQEIQHCGQSWFNWNPKSTWSLCPAMSCNCGSINGHQFQELRIVSISHCLKDQAASSCTSGWPCLQCEDILPACLVFCWEMPAESLSFLADCKNIVSVPGWQHGSLSDFCNFCLAHFFFVRSSCCQPTFSTGIPRCNSFSLHQDSNQVGPHCQVSTMFVPNSLLLWHLLRQMCVLTCMQSFWHFSKAEIGPLPIDLGCHFPSLCQLSVMARRNSHTTSI